jgi:hypothetical protein
LNQKDRTEFDLIHNKIDHITQSIDELKEEMNSAHMKTEENLKFIKENLFNPHEGLWAETRLNTAFGICSNYLKKNQNNSKKDLTYIRFYSYIHIWNQII